MMNAGGLGVGVVFNAADHASAVAHKLTSRFNILAGASDAARAAVQKNVKLIGIGFAQAFVGVKAVTGSFRAASAFGEFEMGIASIAGITRATVGQLRDLKVAAIDAAVKTQFAPKDAVDALRTLAAAGQTATQAIETLKPALDLAAGSLGQLTVPDAAMAIVGTLNAYQMAAENAVTVTDKLLRITQLTNFQARDFGVGLSVAVGKANSFKQSLDDVLIGMGLLRNANIDAMVSQTALSAAFMRIGGEPRVTKIIERLGIKVFDAAGNMRPALDIMSELAAKTADMTDRKRLEIWSSVFERRGILAMNAVARAQITTTKANIYAVTAQSGAVLRGEVAYARLRDRIVKQGGSLKDHTGKVYRDADAIQFLTDSLDKSNQVTVKGIEAINAYRQALKDSEGTAAGYKKVLLDTYQGQLILVGGAWESFKVLFGEGFASTLKPVMSSLYDTIGGKLVPIWQKMSEGIKKAIGVAAAFGGTIMTVSGVLLLLRGVLGLIGFSMKTLLLSMFGVVKMAFPLVAIGIVAWNFFKGFRRGLGEAASATNERGEIIYGFFKRLELIFRSLIELLFTGKLSEGLTKELARGDEGLRFFINDMSVWLKKVELFFSGMIGGIQDAGEVFGDWFGQIDAFFSALLEGDKARNASEALDQTGNSLRKVADAGRDFGRAIAFIGVILIGAKIVTSIMALRKALIALAACSFFVNIKLLIGKITMFFATFSAGVGPMIAVALAIAALIYYWDDVMDALEDAGTWLADHLWRPLWTFLKEDFVPAFKWALKSITFMFMDALDFIESFFLAITQFVWVMIREIGDALASLPGAAGRLGEKISMSARENIMYIDRRLEFLRLPQEEQIRVAEDKERARLFEGRVAMVQIAAQERRTKEERTAENKAYAERMQNLVVQLTVDGEVLAETVQNAQERKATREFAPIMGRAR